MFKHILVPTDGSELSLKAARVAAEVAATHHSRITAMHVVAPYEPPYSADIAFFPPEQTESEYIEAARAKAARLLAEVGEVAAEGQIGFESLTVEGDQPWEAIVGAARAQDCDLIVMGTHARKGIEGFLLGSETTKVLTHSKTPVLVCR
jgi:nucleotide-binding universal stress UspA family protein